MSMPFENTNEDVEYNEMMKLLIEIARDEPYYGTLSTSLPEYRILEKLRQAGYIKYCPYPEEFWVILPAGKKLLQQIVDLSLEGMPNQD